MYIWIWLGVIVLSLVIEFSTMEMASLWFAIGGFFSLILAAFQIDLTYQLIVFIVTSLVLLLSVRKWALKLLTNANDKTNLQLLIGEEFDLLTEIANGTGGTVKVNGVVWSVVCTNAKDVSEGTKVKVLEVKGNKLFVEKGE